MNSTDVRARAPLISLSLIALVLPGNSDAAKTANEAKCDNSTVGDFSPRLAPKARVSLMKNGTGV
jgi:hypothetical protein